MLSAENAQSANYQFSADEIFFRMTQCTLTFFTLYTNSAGDDKLISSPQKQVFVFWEK